MNKVVLIGRLCRDVSVSYNNDMCIARYTLAVDRAYKKDGEPTADFISCVCFGRCAEFAEKYLTKGKKIAVEGRIQTGSYEKDGQKIYTTDVIVDRHEFVESKNAENSTGQYETSVNDDSKGFISVPENDVNDLPFG